MSTRPKSIEADDPLWARMREGDARARALLIEAPTFLIDAVAKTIIRSTPPHVTVEELWSYGAPGLIRAVDTYDPGKGLFRTHAVVCIRSKVLDEIRSQDWAPKSLRRREKDIRVAERVLAQRLKRTPTTHEIAVELELDDETVRTTLMAARHSTHKSLDETTGAGEEHTFTLADMAEAESVSVDESAVVSLWLERIAAWVEGQDELIQRVWAMYYYEQKTLVAIASELGMSTASVTDIHTQFSEAFMDEMKSMITETHS